MRSRFFTALVLALFVAPLWAAPGDLDLSFGGTGKVTTAVGSHSDTGAHSVIQQADGKLVIAGNSYFSDSSSPIVSLVRYNINGSLDTSFDGDGKLSIDMAGQSYKMIQQTDDKLVIVGYSTISVYKDFVLLRLNTDGSLDTSFDGDGKLTTDISSYDDIGYSVVQQADGKLVVAGGSCIVNNGVDCSDITAVLVRYNADGSLDTSFGSNGKLITDLVSSAYSIIQQLDSKLVVVGYNVITRYELDGALDTSFAGDGTFELVRASSVIQQTDGKLVVTQVPVDNYSGVATLVRLNSDGTLDTSFDGDGIQSADFGLYYNYSPTILCAVSFGRMCPRSFERRVSVIQQADSQLVVAGPGEKSFSLLRFHADGSLDASFVIDRPTAPPCVEDPILFIDCPSEPIIFNDATVAFSLIQHADGKLAAAGRYDNNKFTIRRYESGQADTDNDGTFDELDADDDDDSLLDAADNCSLISNVDQLNIDGDAQGDVCDSDNDNDGVPDITDAFPLDTTESVDTDHDGIGNNADTDDDNDGVLDINDFYPLNPEESVNTDGDHIGNNADPDDDNDGKLDVVDNCPLVVNSNQLNTDGDAQGNACDTDDDNDGVLDVSDNCSLVSNADQLNTDGDAQGNVCDSDDDNDTKLDVADNCPLVANLNQLNNDGDSQGDACDADDDNDGVADISDNCSFFPNANQLNTDNDTQGNVCDNDDDNDGVADASDAFPLDATEAVDTDNDTVGDNTDNCVAVSNTDQLNTDGDSEGNVCDNDDDNDGVADISDAFPLDASESVDTDSDTVGDNADNCVAVANTNQLDTDADGAGDVCDTTPNGDTDNDGIDNAVDNCPLIANSNQLDYDADNIGDACDEAVPLPEDIAGVMKNAKAGSAVAFAGDVNGDGYGDYVIGMPGYDIPAAPPVKIIKDAGRAEVISGKTGAVLMSVNGVAAKDAMGFAVAGNGDIDNDGFDDVVVGAPNADDFAFGLADTGSVTILFGPNGDRKLPFIGKTKKSLSGSAVALADVNDDNHADIIIGAPKADDVARSLIDAGNVTIISGNGYGVLNTFYVAKAKANANANAGTSVAAGDINNDGKADIIIGAPNDDGASKNLKDAGSVSVYDISGTELLRKYGAVAKAHFGKAVASGDVNNDGVDDVLVGAPDDDHIYDNGKMKDVGSVTVFSGSDGSLLVKKIGTVVKISLGNSVTAGDVNADGYADIIAGAKLDDKPALPKITKDAGSVSIWSGNGYTLIDTVYGDAANDYFGTVVSAGDINSDGKSDVIIGIPGFDALPMLPATKPMKEAGDVKVLSGAGLGF